MPAKDEFPIIPADLLEALDKRYPEASPESPTQTHAELMFRGGQRQVVRFLAMKKRQQDKNLLEA